ncbi:GAF and ANTAR domain-containing protein [Arthrobacter sp. ISL-30]|uniref:GAF and ANTAR domain-containing protein n=1 Tax=Arthrobacter sp. ISL-30 TaxID=2819109 RepID=UPI001BE62857|nr:GAF and ANTAR domain-containing protein [Arthrobacter sp. ISL-30]MBT2512518.1 GAF and ANTAR domain-containing protein [Arthrobacter sp. ISL-30]
MASESTAPPAASISEYLQELVLNSSDVEQFLHELASVSARSLSEPRDEVLCGVTLLRRRKAATVASSSAEAQAMDEIQYTFGDGPCMTACREQSTIHIPDLADHDRWPKFTESVLGRGVRSILAVPLKLEGDTRAALNFYSHRPGRFEPRVIELAEDFVRQTSMALRLAVRFAHFSDAAEDLRATLESRTVIDVAVGIIMAQNRCTQSEAFEILKAASSSRNIKLHGVATAIVESLGQGPLKTHFEM